MSLIRFLFYFLFPEPKIGERRIFIDNSSDPWNPGFYEVIDRKGDWYRIALRGNRSNQWSIRKRDLVAFYVVYLRGGDPTTVNTTET